MVLQHGEKQEGETTLLKALLLSAKSAMIVELSWIHLL